jgi:DNA-binding LacI/PurR family transcriptional regulator
MPSARSKRTTLYDVARQAGVSYQTVSRVINNHPHVAGDTRQRIMAIIDSLGYRPSRAARSLATQRSCTLGIVTFGAHYFGPAQMMLNAERAAKAQGYSLRLSSIADMSPGEVQEAIGGLRDQMVDGIILIMPTQGISYAHLTEACGEIPFVETDTEAAPDIPSVVIDQYAGSRLATEYLLGLGHHAIAEISGPLNWYSAAARHQSCRATLEAAGIAPGPHVEGDWTAASGYDGARCLLDRGVEFTALVAGNDQMALGAMRALSEAGRQVPEDVSVVGFDDIPEAAYFEPPLSTVQQDFAALGEESVKYLVSLIDDPDTLRQQRVLQPRFIARSSARRVEQ